MDEFIHKTSQAIGWFLALDTHNKLILGGGFLALMLLLNWLWKKSRDRGSTERVEAPRAYIIPAAPRPQPSYGPVDEDITEFKDVHYHALPMMSQTEINFWCLLYQAAPGYHIFPQVATSALLNAQSSDPDHFRAALRAYSTTRIDFVISDAKLNIVALVELDDKSHDDKKEKDRRRDFITGQAGYRTVRFDCRKWPNVEQIKKKIFG